MNHQNIYKSRAINAVRIPTRFYLQFISIHHVAERPDGVNDSFDVGGVIRHFSLYVHLVFFQQFNFFPHPFKELLTLSSQCFLPGIANIVDQFFLRLSNNISNKVNRYISISNLYLTFKRLHIVH